MSISIILLAVANLVLLLLVIRNTADIANLNEDMLTMKMVVLSQAMADGKDVPDIINDIVKAAKEMGSENGG